MEGKNDECIEAVQPIAVVIYTNINKILVYVKKK